MLIEILSEILSKNFWTEIKKKRPMSKKIKKNTKKNIIIKFIYDVIDLVNYQNYSIFGIY